MKRAVNKEISKIFILRLPFTSEFGFLFFIEDSRNFSSMSVISDPWFYNEYTDAKNSRADFQNYQAVENLVQWAIEQTR